MDGECTNCGEVGNWCRCDEEQPVEKPIALFDMDGTLFDYAGQLLSDLALMRSPDEAEVTEEMLYEQHQHATMPWLERRIYVIKRQPGWYTNLPRFQLGWDVLEMARTLDFAIQIFTKGPRKHFEAWGEKGECIAKHFADDENIIVNVVGSKAGKYGRVLVDDYPGYIKDWLASRPRGLVVMPANAGNAEFTHPNVVRYDGTVGSRVLVHNALKAARLRRDRQHWREVLSSIGT